MIFEGEKNKTIFNEGEEQCKCPHMGGMRIAARQICDLGIACPYTDFGRKILCEDYQKQIDPNPQREGPGGSGSSLSNSIAIGVQEPAEGG